MAMNESAVLLAATGYIYTAEVGTVAPTPQEIADFDPSAGLGEGTWTTLGHTSREELPSFGYDGGDTETLGSWQASALKQVVSEVPVDYVTFNLLQFDDSALELYYGVTNSSETPGMFSVADASTSSAERAITIVLVDGDVNVAFHSARTGIRREDAIELAVDELASMPLRATFLKRSDSPLFSWINDSFINTSPSS